jgi:hypothetical protein
MIRHLFFAIAILALSTPCVPANACPLGKAFRGGRGALRAPARAVKVIGRVLPRNR